MHLGNPPVAQTTILYSPVHTLIQICLKISCFFLLPLLLENCSRKLLIFLPKHIHTNMVLCQLHPLASFFLLPSVSLSLVCIYSPLRFHFPSLKKQVLVRWTVHFPSHTRSPSLFLFQSESFLNMDDQICTLLQMNTQ